MRIFYFKFYYINIIKLLARVCSFLVWNYKKFYLGYELLGNYSCSRYYVFEQCDIKFVSYILLVVVH